MVVFGRFRKSVLYVLLAFSITLWAEATWLYLKAELAQVLIAHAWQKNLSISDRENHPGVKPWSWADTWPVARMQVHSHNVDLFVLAGTGGHALAFGPGYDESTALPGKGSSVIGGHRDTHFKFMQHLPLNTVITIQSQDGIWNQYRVTEQKIVDSRRDTFSIAEGDHALWLVTCYPFDAVRAGGPLRYIIKAEPCLTGCSSANNSELIRL